MKSGRKPTLTSLKVLRGVEVQKAFDKGMSKETTVRGLSTLLEAIYTGKAASKASTGEMQAILKRQKFNDGIPAGVPKDVAVGHKTGTITKIHHDAAIVYADEDARRAGLPCGKSECWYVVAAESGAQIGLGLKEGVTRADFEAAVRKGEAADQLLNWSRVQAGEMLYNPAGKIGRAHV